jgi:hypothetical protein
MGEIKMNKSLTAFFVLFFFTGVGAASETQAYINAKIGYDFAGAVYVDVTDDPDGDIYDSLVNNGFSLSLEAVGRRTDSPKLRGGVGLEFVVPRKDKSVYERNIAFLPVYITAEWYPFKEYFFMKLNIGYNFIWYDGANSRYDYFEKSSAYAALISGFDIAKGIFVDISYSFYFAAAENFYAPDLAYFKAGIGIGYKFRI